MRPSWVEIDLGAVAHNVEAFRAHLGDTQLCAVVKADAYGHGDVPVAETALEHGASWLAVALLEEGIRLREAGIESPVLLLSEPKPSDAGIVAEWELTPTVYRQEFLEALAELHRPVPAIHLKLDSGMHRVGAEADVVVALVHRADALGLSIGGLWTHFAVAESDDDYTRLQQRRLDELVERLAGLVPSAAIVHHSNTAGAILVGGGGMARVGLGLYGLYPSRRCRDRIELRPAMRIVSEVTHVRRHPAGTRPSYGRRRALEADSVVATVPIGYADGLPRALTDRGRVLIGGKARPFAGTITMDQVMVDCGQDPVSVGDDVVFMGSQGEAVVTADDWADHAETITYEIVSRIGQRLPRRFIE